MKTSAKHFGEAIGP